MPVPPRDFFKPRRNRGRHVVPWLKRPGNPEQSCRLGQAGHFTEASEPFALFYAWMAEAKASEPNDPEAMALATVDSHGLPNVRMILLKGADRRGFVFYTNSESAKGLELAANPKAALLFHWKSLGRQVRMRGLIEPATDAEADAYFAARHRESQIGACASAQSRPLKSRAAFEKDVARWRGSSARDR